MQHSETTQQPKEAKYTLKCFGPHVNQWKQNFRQNIKRSNWYVGNEHNQTTTHLLLARNKFWITKEVGNS